MTPDELKEFIQKVKQTDITEIAWDDGSTRIHLKLLPQQSKQTTASAVGSEIKTEQSEEKETIPIKSTMVGVFYHSISPDHPPFVIEGSTVKVGQKVGVIESLKIFRDVVSNVNGKIVKILVNNAQPVEYGQELFLVEPEELSSAEQK